MPASTDTNPLQSNSSQELVPRKHVLLTVLGTNPRTATYRLGDQNCEAELAPVALINLLSPEERPHKILALCTDEAKIESFEKLKAGVGDQCLVSIVKINKGEEQAEIDEFLKTVTQAIVEENKQDTKLELTVDITHGYRHFSFLTYLAVLYVSALKGVHIRGAYYGLLGFQGTISPFFDLEPLLALPEWIYAIKVLNDTGSTLPLAKILGKSNDHLNKQVIHKLEKYLTQFTKEYLSGLPLELGATTDQIQRDGKHVKNALTKDSPPVPLADELVEQLNGHLQRFGLAQSQNQGVTGKSDIQLNDQELERQRKVVDSLLEHENISTALGLMREWTVSWVLSMTNQEQPVNWLDHKPNGTRNKAEKQLEALVTMSKDSDLKNNLSLEQNNFVKFWQGLKELRNGYHHHGMRPQNMSTKEVIGKYEKIRDYWSKKIANLDKNSLLPIISTNNRVLISPIGIQPGVLYSALKVCQNTWGAVPSTCIVVCSSESESYIEESKRHAGYKGNIEQVFLDDPHGSGENLKYLVEDKVKLTRKWLYDAEDVLVNLTGGTTFMGLLVERLANDASYCLARTVRKFGLIDLRSTDAQDKRPFVEGKPFWLDGEDRS